MRYKLYTIESGRQLISAIDEIVFKEGTSFATIGNTIRVSGFIDIGDGIYKRTGAIFAIPESHPFFNIGLLINSVEGYGQIPLTSRKLIHKYWVQFTEMTFKYIVKKAL